MCEAEVCAESETDCEIVTWSSSGGQRGKEAGNLHGVCVQPRECASREIFQLLPERSFPGVCMRRKRNSQDLLCSQKQCREGSERNERQEILPSAERERERGGRREMSGGVCV